MMNCQSCGMPMEKPEDHADGNPDSEYCKYCMKDGKFTMDKEALKKKMIEIFTSSMDLNKEQASKKVDEILSGLKRWKEEK